MSTQSRCPVKYLKTVVPVAVALVVGLWLSGCDAAGADDPGMTFDELQSRIAAATSDGRPFSFTMDELTSEARVEYLESIGRDDRAPEDFDGVTISYEPESAYSSRASSSSRCLITKYTISHSPTCTRPGVKWIQRRISNHGRCPHSGYSASYGRQTLGTCRNSSCVYESNKRVYYHRPSG